MGVRSMSAHPGSTVTNLQVTGPTHNGGPNGLVQSITKASQRISGLWKEIAQGVLPALYAATSPDAESGGYYGPGGFGELTGPPAPARVPTRALDEVDSARLWEVTEAFARVCYPTDNTGHTPI